MPIYAVGRFNRALEKLNIFCSILDGILCECIVSLNHLSEFILTNSTYSLVHRFKSMLPTKTHLPPPYNLVLSIWNIHCVFSLVKFSATLLLVPLLGMQYILTPFRPEEGADGAFAYELISAIITSFQVCANNLLCMVWASAAEIKPA